ncbi:hypothetical protein OAL24_01295 [Oenococcus sicerae]|nr:hypothetical protein OAL24_01295 [Oenococcus sicerae]
MSAKVNALLKATLINGTIIGISAFTRLKKLPVFKLKPRERCASTMVENSSDKIGTKRSVIEINKAKVLVSKPALFKGFKRLEMPSAI